MSAVAPELSGAGWFSLGDVLAGHAASRPDKIALVCGPDRLSWRALDRRVDALVDALAARGVTRGDRVLWLGQDCHRLLEALFAAARLGAVLCPVNWRQSVEELRFALADAEPAVVLWQSEEIGDTVISARSAPSQVDGRVQHWIQHDDPGEHGYEALLAGARGTPPPSAGSVDPAQPVLMLYTAAFDGRPSGALLSQTALLAQTTTLRLLEGVAADEVFLNSGPLFHIGTLRRTLAVAHAGGRNVMLRRVVPAELCRLVDAERCTGAFLQRPTMEQMVAVNVSGRYDMSSLRGASGPSGWDDVVTVATPPVRSGYGQTELAGVVTFSHRERP